ncbi:MAG: hypothetical protein R3C49_25445 [Planctomycetaceae bacterium]
MASRPAPQNVLELPVPEITQRAQTRYIPGTSFRVAAQSDVACECPQQRCPSSGCSVCDESGRVRAFDISAVSMFRSRPQSQRLFESPVTASEFVDASQFRIGLTPGFEAGLIAYDFVPLFDLEVRALWMDEWADGTAQNFSGRTIRILTEPPLGTSGPRETVTMYRSAFLNAEVNARFHPFGVQRPTTLLAGFRMFRLQEDLTAIFADPFGVLPDEQMLTETDNHLYGLQIGLDRGILEGCRSCLRLRSRVGLYGNQSDQLSQAVSLASPPVTFPVRGSGQSLAFQAELGLQAGFRITESLNLITSYRCMYLNGLAVASEQLAASNFPLATGLHTNGSLLLQSTSVGLEFVY